MSTGKSITKEEIRLLPLGFFTGNTVVVNSKALLETALEVLNGETILGFDTETKPNFVKGKFNRVALLQLANQSTAYLFPLAHYGMSEGLKAILESSSIVKVGVAIGQDMKELKRDYQVEPQNHIDLNRQARARGYRNVGIRNLAGLVMGIRISKSKQMSNWEKNPLDQGQIRYAATDAWVCLKIYQAFNTPDSED